MIEEEIRKNLRIYQFADIYSMEIVYRIDLLLDGKLFGVLPLRYPMKMGAQKSLNMAKKKALKAVMEKIAEIGNSPKIEKPPKIKFPNGTEIIEIVEQ